jgi:ribosomal protein S18 acetylase RimI-like enzyme
MRRSALAEAVEADLVAHVALLYEPVGEVHRGAGSVWFASEGREPNENGVLRAEIPARDPGPAVDRLLAPFREGGRAMMWWIFEPPTPRASELDDVLRRRGLTLVSDIPGMALRLDRSPVRRPTAGVRVRRVVDSDDLAIWAEIVGRAFGDARFPEGRSVRGFAAWGFGDDAPFRHYVCRLGNEWVGASTLSLASGGAGLANIATVPEARRLGVGSTVAGTALDQAAALGRRTVTLSAEESGRSLYERLGFREVSRHRTYVWRPD